MLQQDFDAHQNQDQSAGNFSFGFEFGAEQVPDFYAQHGEKKGNNANTGSRRKDWRIQKSEADADGKSVQGTLKTALSGFGPKDLRLCRQRHILSTQRSLLPPL